MEFFIENGLNQFLIDILVLDKYEEILYKSLEVLKSLLVKGQLKVLFFLNIDLKIWI